MNALAGVSDDWPRAWDDPELLVHPLFSGFLNQSSADQFQWEDSMVSSTLAAPRIGEIVKRWAVVALADTRAFVPRDIQSEEARAFWRVLLALRHASPADARVAFDAFRASADAQARINVIYERPPTGPFRNSLTPSHQPPQPVPWMPRDATSVSRSTSGGAQGPVPQRYRGNTVLMVNGVPVSSLPSSAPEPVAEPPHDAVPLWVKAEPVEAHLSDMQGNWDLHAAKQEIAEEAARLPTPPTHDAVVAEVHPTVHSTTLLPPLVPSTPRPPKTEDLSGARYEEFKQSLLRRMDIMANSPTSAPAPSRAPVLPPRARAPAAVPSRGAAPVASSSCLAPSPAPVPSRVLGKRKRANSRIPSRPFMRRPRTEATPEVWSDEDMVREPPRRLVVKPDSDAEMTLVEDSAPRRAVTWREYALDPAQASQTPRPPLPEGMRPAVWAKTRQEICETLPWFRSYQGGVSSKDGLAYGYLLGKHPSPRDAFLHGGKLIISHGGGGSATVAVEVEDVVDQPVPADDNDSDAEKPGVEQTQEDPVSAASTPAPENPRKGKRKVKKTQLVKDQSARKGQVQPLITAMKNQHPLLLLADQRFKLFPYDLGERMFVVLGWYWVKEAWAEAEPAEKAAKGYYTRTKLAFQWIEAQGEPWWLRQPAPESATVPMPLKQDPDEQMPRWQDPDQQMPRKLHQASLAKSGISSDDRRCTKCQQPAKRVYTQGWMCLEPLCRAYWRLVDEPDGSQGSPCGPGLTYDPAFVALGTPSPLLAARKVEDYCPRRPAPNEMLGFWCDRCGRVTCRRRWEVWECDSCGYLLPVSMPVRDAGAFAPLCGVPFGGECKVTDVLVRKERFTLPVDEEGHVAWVNRFTLPFNRGVIYHILGNSKTNQAADDILIQSQRDFAAAPLLRRHRLSKHKIASPMLTQYFSQNFGVPYRFVAETDSTIPFDAAPSSVNNALAVIRQGAKLVTKAAEFNEMLVAAYLDGQSMNYHSDFEPGLREDIATLSLGSPALMKFRPYSGKGKKNHPASLSLTLSHGDVLVMHGVDVQKFYEHTVIPTGFRIAATARYIEVVRTAKNENT